MALNPLTDILQTPLAPQQASQPVQPPAVNKPATPAPLQMPSTTTKLDQQIGKFGDFVREHINTFADKAGREVVPPEVQKWRDAAKNPDPFSLKTYEEQGASVQGLVQKRIASPEYQKLTPEQKVQDRYENYYKKYLVPLSKAAGKPAPPLKEWLYGTKHDNIYMSDPQSFANPNDPAMAFATSVRQMADKTSLFGAKFSRDAFAAIYGLKDYMKDSFTPGARVNTDQILKEAYEKVDLRFFNQWRRSATQAVHDDDYFLGTRPRTSFFANATAWTGEQIATLPLYITGPGELKVGEGVAKAIGEYGGNFTTRLAESPQGQYVARRVTNAYQAIAGTMVSEGRDEFEKKDIGIGVGGAAVGALFEHGIPKAVDLWNKTANWFGSIGSNAVRGTVVSPGTASTRGARIRPEPEDAEIVPKGYLEGGSNRGGTNRPSDPSPIPSTPSGSFASKRAWMENKDPVFYTGQAGDSTYEARFIAKGTGWNGDNDAIHVKVRGPNGKTYGTLDLTIHPDAPDDASINLSYISESNRGQGKGKQLYIQGAKAAQAMGFKTFSSDWAVSEEAHKVWDSFVKAGIARPLHSLDSPRGSQYRMDLSKLQGYLDRLQGPPVTPVKANKLADVLEWPKPPAEKTKLEAFLDKVKEKQAREEYGQSLLDDMQERNITPRTTSEIFWTNTYHQLPEDLQKAIQAVVKAQFGHEPGDIIGTDRNRKPIIAKDWPDVARTLSGDSGDHVDYLEGTERGYVAMMHDANEHLGNNNVYNFPEEMRDDIDYMKMAGLSGEKKETPGELKQFPTPPRPKAPPVKLPAKVLTMQKPVNIANDMSIKQWSAEHIALGGSPHIVSLVESAFDMLTDQAQNTAARTTRLHLLDPVKGDMIAGEMMAQQSLAIRTYGQALEKLSPEQQVRVYRRRLELVREAMHELPIHVKDVHKQSVKAELAKQAENSPVLKKQMESLQKDLQNDFKVDLSDIIAEKEQEEIAQQSGIKDPDKVASKLGKRPPVEKRISPRTFAQHKVDTIVHYRNNYNKSTGMPKVDKRYTEKAQPHQERLDTQGRKVGKRDKRTQKQYDADKKTDELVKELIDADKDLIHFEEDYHRLLYHYSMRDYLSDALKGRILEALKNEGLNKYATPKMMKQNGKNIAEGWKDKNYAYQSDRLFMHLRMMAESGRLSGEKNIFGSTELHNWATPWMVQLNTEVDDLQMRFLRKTAAMHPLPLQAMETWLRVFQENRAQFLNDPEAWKDYNTAIDNWLAGTPTGSGPLKLPEELEGQDVPK